MKQIQSIAALLIICVVLSHQAIAQVQKPIRKGMPPGKEVTETVRPLYSIAQLKGKWQETHRRPVNAKETIAFTDTMLIKIDSNKVELKDATSMRMSMLGMAEIVAPATLLAAGDEYFIRTLSSGTMVLADSEFERTFQKKERYYYETVGKIIVPGDSIKKPMPLDALLLPGKWIVYRRQAQAGSIDASIVLIKSIEINSVTADSARGKVVCYRSDVSESLPCTLYFGETSFRIVTQKHNWQFNNYMLNNKEFIFGDAATLVYYSRH